MENQATVRLELDNDEALVLFEFLAREVDDANGERLKSLTNHDGELWALNGLHCVLERALSVPFSKDYKKALSDAKECMVQRCGSWPD